MTLDPNLRTSIRTQAKLCQAMHSLALGPGRIKERLITACEQGLVHVPDNHLPPDLEMELQRLKARVTAAGSIAATIDAMTEDEAMDIARRIEALRDQAEALPTS